MKPTAFFFLLFLSLIYPAFAQQDQRANRQPRLTVIHHGWSRDGELVLGVRIEPQGEALQLGKVRSVRVGKDHSESEEHPFSTATGYLIVPGSGARISALQRLPSKPFFGTGKVTDTLKPGQSLTMGIAFGQLPALPTTAGKSPTDPAQYQLTLHLPGIGKTDFAIPVPSDKN